jgi:hypothetical protein
MLLPSRRAFLRSSVVLGAGAGLTLLTQAADPPGPKSTDDLVSADTQAAIDYGLAHLATRSQANDGSFSDVRNNSGNTGITALAALALMCGGHHPGRGRYGRSVSRAAEYILSRGRANKTTGYLANSDQLDGHSAMYQHGFATLFLAEVHGTFPDADRRTRTRDMLEKAVALTVKSQNQQGGWRYTPAPGQDDVSVTVAQLMALRAAKNAGVYVDKAVVDKAVEYIKACYQKSDGGFAYIKGQQGSLFPRSAAGVVGLYSAGIYSGEIIEKGLNYLQKFRPRGNRQGPADVRQEHYYYGHYYAALAMWTAGGANWNDWFPAIRSELLLRREPVTSVWDDRIFGAAYSTAMACIILQLPNNYLPIMQK